MPKNSLTELSNKTGIPAKELNKLLALPYGEGKLPAPIALKNLSFAKGTINDLREELEPHLKQLRKDAQKKVNQAFRLIVCNLVVSVVSKQRLSLAGTEKAYNKGTYLQSLFLTFRAVNTVTKALIKAKYLTFRKGSKAKKEVNSYQPTKKLELLLLPLLYEVQEEYLGDDRSLTIFKAKKPESSGIGGGTSNGLLVHRTAQNYIMRRRSNSPDLPLDHPDRAGLRRINEYLKNVTYALKAPVRRIYSNEDPMQGGRLYTHLQGLPDRRVRIRINTLLDGKPVAEVDLSANHPRMLMALENQKLSENFYDDIAAKTKTSREQVKFLVTRAIGASNKRFLLKPKVAKKHWHKTDFVITPKQRIAIENTIEESCPLLFEKFYKGMGTYLQGLEGDILMKTMLSLIEQDIPSLPIHDAILVQKRHASKAKRALEIAWMEVLGVGFKPSIKIDES